MPTDTVETAARALSQRRIGGAPVLDDDGIVVGLLEDDDLIVQDTRLHFPTVISLFGGYLELPSSLHRFEADLRKAVGATVADVMDADAPTCRADDTLETVATALHEQQLLADGRGRRRRPAGRDRLEGRPRAGHRGRSGLPWPAGQRRLARTTERAARRAWAEVDLGAIRHNAGLLAGWWPRPRCARWSRPAAYGHGRWRSPGPR